MKVVSSESIILKTQDFREKDRLVTFLARDRGRMTGVARGARGLSAKNLGNFEPFSQGVMFYTESRTSDLVTIRKCDPTPPYLMLGKSYEKFLFAGYFTELVMLSRIPEGEAEKLFLLLAEGLAQLDQVETSKGASAKGGISSNALMSLHQLRLDFELGMLAALGLMPDWTRCGDCGRLLLQVRQGRPEVLVPQGLYFDPAQGYLRCSECPPVSQGVVRVSVGSLAYLVARRRSGEADAHAVQVRPTRTNLRELERILRAHLTHNLETVPRSLALLPKVEDAG